jgi:hypothetical protein
MAMMVASHLNVMQVLGVQVEMAASGLDGLGENPVAPTENLALLGALEGEEEAPKGPTMMGREARELMLSGQGTAGLAAWKVIPAAVQHPSKL